MKIFGLDTSTMISTCAVIDEGGLLGEYTINQEMSHSEKLVPMIKEMLDNINMKVSDIDLYTVAIGPGSFTGLRIGVATVKTLAHLFNKPIIGISTLEALAYNLPYNEIIVPMIDARRNRVYTGIYTWENEKIKEIMEPDVIEIDRLIEKLNNYEKIIVNGDGSLIHREEIRNEMKDRVEFATIGQNISRSTSVCEIGKEKYALGQVDNFYTLSPDYLRPSQAERELKKKQVK